MHRWRFEIRQRDPTLDETQHALGGTNLVCAIDHVLFMQILNLCMQEATNR